jgi:hypothetical protein
MALQYRTSAWKVTRNELDAIESRLSKPLDEVVGFVLKNHRALWGAWPFEDPSGKETLFKTAVLALKSANKDLSKACAREEKDAATAMSEDAAKALRKVSNLIFQIMGALSVSVTDVRPRLLVGNDKENVPLGTDISDKFDLSSSSHSVVAHLIWGKKINLVLGEDPADAPYYHPVFGRGATFRQKIYSQSFTLEYWLKLATEPGRDSEFSVPNLTYQAFAQMLIMRDVIHNGLGFRVDGNIRGALSSTVQSAAEPVDEQSSTSVSGRMVTRKRGIGAINSVWSIVARPQYSRLVKLLK